MVKPVSSLLAICTDGADTGGLPTWKQYKHVGGKAWLFCVHLRAVLVTLP